MIRLPPTGEPMNLPEPNEGQLETSALTEPAFNIGQQVVWLTGIKHYKGTIVRVTNVKFQNNQWYLEINGGGTVFPGRVAAFYKPEEGTT